MKLHRESEQLCRVIGREDRVRAPYLRCYVASYQRNTMLPIELDPEKLWMFLGEERPRLLGSGGTLKFVCKSVLAPMCVFVQGK
jgi:hypothetical protein